MQYQSVEQLLTDEGFLAWYLGTDKGQVERWTHWILASKENSELARQAYDLLRSIREAEGKSLPPEDVARMWTAIEARIGRNIG